MRRLSIVIISLLLFSCENKTGIAISKNKATEIKFSKTGTESLYEEYKENDLTKADLEKVLTNALAIADRNKGGESFHKEYEDNKNSHSVKVSLKLGKLFHGNCKHLYVKRMDDIHGVAINIYLLKEGKFAPLFSVQRGRMEYINDTIMDINGDGAKDFDFHWYPMSGCCLKNMHDVYLLKSQSGLFTQHIDLVNPTFYPDKKLIRGVTSGYMGWSASLYTDRWEGLKLVNVEEIYHASYLYDPSYPNFPDSLKNIYYIKTPTGDSIRLTEIPKRYMDIDEASLEWFSNTEGQ